MQVPLKLEQLVLVVTLAQTMLCRDPPAQSLNMQLLANANVAKASDRADR